MKQLGKILLVVGWILCNSVIADPVALGHVSYKDLKMFKGVNFILIPLKNNLDKYEYLFILQDGKIYEDGIVLTHDDLLIDEVTVMGWGKNINQHHLLTLQKEPHSPRYEKLEERVVVISSPGGENYYHWMFQILPRIKMLQESKIPFDKLYFYDIVRPYQIETLKNLGIKEKEIIIGKPDTILTAKELIVPSIPIWPAKGKTFSPWVIDYLKSNFLNDTQSNCASQKIYPDKIFISRKKSALRNIINEDEVEQALVQKGYSLVFLEDYSVAEQAYMFAHAKEIIGVHGSGLTNLLFSQKRTKVIEIDPFDGHRSNFSLLAKQQDLNYFNLPTNTKNLSLEQIEREDLYVDVDKLVSLL